MYEVVERDAVARAEPHDLRPVDLETIEDVQLSALLERFRAAKVRVAARFVANRFRIPTFDAHIWSEAMPVICKGIGTHLDARVALSRALTEAAQSRVTIIAGARDDIGRAAYRTVHSFDPPAGSEQVRFSAGLLDIDAEVAWAAERIRQVTGHGPLYADLTRADVGVPVVHVVVPGARQRRASAS